MAAKRKASVKRKVTTPKRRAGPGRFPRESYAQLEVHLVSVRDKQLPSVVGTVTLRLPQGHRASDMTIQVCAVQTLVAKP